MNAIEQILDKIRLRILSVVSATNVDTEGFNDLIAAYETFNNELDKKKQERYRELSYTTGPALKARIRANINNPISLMKIMRDIENKK